MFSRSYSVTLDVMNASDRLCVEQLGVGHTEQPEFLFQNERLFSSLLPWLFPYGKEEIGQYLMKEKFSENNQKKYLMCYDKRFQLIPCFLCLLSTKVRSSRAF